MGVVALVVHLLFELFAGEKIATVLAVLAAVVTYAVTLILIGGVTEAEMKEMPMGTRLIAICKKLHLLRGESN